MGAGTAHASQVSGTTDGGKGTWRPQCDPARPTDDRSAPLTLPSPFTCFPVTAPLHHHPSACTHDHSSHSPLPTPHPSLHTPYSSLTSSPTQ
ncbi:hypothetical protein E2C01_098747 [Portunus trituberculatus]|uniref:Uncharacterized protein n=1 Tax=Portunus trituberculatus TaxID=210409 RepID=A0A5B7K911_PORTR|nr:hypothetical protein [Portunus trituberculatus]